MPRTVLFCDLEIEGQGHKTIPFVALPIYTHIPNLKGLTKIILVASLRSDFGHFFTFWPSSHIQKVRSSYGLYI